MAIPLPDFAVLKKTISAVTDDRVLSHILTQDEDALVVLRIPVREKLPSDPKDTAIRRFVTDWLKRHVKKGFRLGVKSRFEELERGQVFWTEDDAGNRTEIPVAAALVFNLWERAEDDGFQKYREETKRRRLEESGS